MIEPKEGQIVMLQEYCSDGVVCGIFSSVDKAKQAAIERANAIADGVRDVDDRDHEIVIACNDKSKPCLNITLWDIDRKTDW